MILRLDLKISQKKDPFLDCHYKICNFIRMIIYMYMAVIMKILDLPFWGGNISVKCMLIWVDYESDL